MISLQPWGTAESSVDIRARWLGGCCCRCPKAMEEMFSFGVNDTTLENGKTRVELSNSIENCREILSAAKQLFPVLTGDHRRRIVGKISESPICQGRLMCRELDVPYLDFFTLCRVSYLDEAAANDGSPRLSWLCRISALGTKLVCLVVLVQSYSFGQSSPVMFTRRRTSVLDENCMDQELMTAPGRWGGCDHGCRCRNAWA